MAVPGWPLPTFWTASIARTRTVSTALSSSSFQSSFAGVWLTRISLPEHVGRCPDGHVFMRLRAYSPRALDCEAPEARALRGPCLRPARTRGPCVTYVGHRAPALSEPDL